MKYQCKTNENIFFEEMKNTPISYLGGLTLVSVLSWAADVYFFFEGWQKNKARRSYVAFYLKISFRTAYRLMNEQEAYSSVWKYTSSDKASYRRQNGEYCKVAKLWGTPYIEEMNKSGIYSDYKKDVDKKVFQITIVTEEETIELVMPREMDWVKYNPKKVKEVIIDLVKTKN